MIRFHPFGGRLRKIHSSTRLLFTTCTHHGDRHYFKQAVYFPPARHQNKTSILRKQTHTLTKHLPLRQVRTVRHFVGTGLFNFIQPKPHPLKRITLLLLSSNVIFLAINHTNRQSHPVRFFWKPVRNPQQQDWNYRCCRRGVSRSVHECLLRRLETRTSPLSYPAGCITLRPLALPAQDQTPRRIGSSDSKRSGSYNRNYRKLRLRTAWGRWRER